ncbi:hypothetical protein DQ384_24190 [Sphaerisporangium album]|uniref:Uncharacterized protein n=1 Tax=Sphaerisporangium album TaxID=509200 RepID=A0A367FEZ4_9ACTN|nr:hypothetical protein [Sphaerisporangium album]RCG28235.1 hypothetical protein DQ384_24190 [Sphaerisporangium album]
MNKLGTAEPPPSLTGTLSEWFGQAAQIATGISGMSYAFGWLLTARFYGGLGVDPEEVGVTFSWLVVRAFLIGLLGLVVVLGVRRLLQVAGRSGPITRLVQSRTSIILSLLLTCAGMAGVIVLAYLVWLAPAGTDPTGTVIAIFACAALIGLIVWWMRPSSFRLRWNSRYWLRGLAGALLGFLVTATALLPFRLGDRLVAEVRAGRPVTIDVLPGVSAIKVAEVRVTSADPATPGPAVTCVLRLGGGAGTSVFVAEGKVLRVSDQNVTVTSPC